MLANALACVLVVVAIASSSSSSSSRTSGPASYAELARSLPRGLERRAAALLKFAKDRRPAVADRVRAAQQARRGLAAADGRRAASFLLEAHLAAVQGSRSKRSAALAGAAAAARAAGQTDKAARIGEASAGDEAARKLAATLGPVGAGPPGAIAPALVDAVVAAQPAWRAIDDTRAELAARVLLARAQAAAGAVDVALTALAAAADEGGDDRDAAAVVVEAHAARAALALAAGRANEAAVAALSADHARPPPLQARTFTPPVPPPYARTRETAAVCKAARDAGASCAQLELQRFGARTFYDFSRERRGPFDGARAGAVLAEYESLLHDCMRASAKTGETADSRIELEWSVQHDGRVTRFELKPKRLRGGAFDACLQRAFAVFRYPPYTGEQQHIALSFSVGPA